MSDITWILNTLCIVHNKDILPIMNQSTASSAQLQFPMTKLCLTCWEYQWYLLSSWWPAHVAGQEVD